MGGLMRQLLTTLVLGCAIATNGAPSFAQSSPTGPVEPVNFDDCLALYKMMDRNVFVMGTSYVEAGASHSVEDMLAGLEARGSALARSQGYIAAETKSRQFERYLTSIGPNASAGSAPQTQDDILEQAMRATSGPEYQAQQEVRREWAAYAVECEVLATAPLPEPDNIPPAGPFLYSEASTGLCYVHFLSAAMVQSNPQTKQRFEQQALFMLQKAVEDGEGDAQGLQSFYSPYAEMEARGLFTRDGQPIPERVQQKEAQISTCVAMIRESLESAD